MPNKNFVCASTQCRRVIREDDPRVKIGKFTYCLECAEKKK